MLPIIPISDSYCFDRVMLMINRLLPSYILNAMKHCSIIALTGPKQSGKTTLVRKLLPNIPYINLKSCEQRLTIRQDFSAFLARFK